MAGYKVIVIGDKALTATSSNYVEGTPVDPLDRRQHFMFGEDGTIQSKLYPNRVLQVMVPDDQHSQVVLGNRTSHDGSKSPPQERNIFPFLHPEVRSHGIYVEIPESPRYNIDKDSQDNCESADHDNNNNDNDDNDDIMDNLDALLEERAPHLEQFNKERLEREQSKQEHKDKERAVRALQREAVQKVQEQQQAASAQEEQQATASQSEERKVPDHSERSKQLQIQTWKITRDMYLQNKLCKQYLGFPASASGNLALTPKPNTNSIYALPAPTDCSITIRNITKHKISVYQETAVGNTHLIATLDAKVTSLTLSPGAKLVFESDIPLSPQSSVVEPDAEIEIQDGSIPAYKILLCNKAHQPITIYAYSHKWELYRKAEAQLELKKGTNLLAVCTSNIAVEPETVTITKPETITFHAN